MRRFFFILSTRKTILYTLFLHTRVQRTQVSVWVNSEQFLPCYQSTLDLFCSKSGTQAWGSQPVPLQTELLLPLSSAVGREGRWKVPILSGMSRRLEHRRAGSSGEDLKSLVCFTGILWGGPGEEQPPELAWSRASKTTPEAQRPLLLFSHLCRIHEVKGHISLALNVVWPQHCSSRKSFFFFFFGLRSCCSWILQFPSLAGNFFFPHDYIQKLLVPEHNNNNLMSWEYRERLGLMTLKLNHHIYSVPPSFCVSVTWCHNSLKLHQGIVVFFFSIVTVWTWGHLWGHEDSSVLPVSCLMDELNWKQRSWVMFILHVTKSQHTQGLQGWYCCLTVKAHTYIYIRWSSLKV